MAATRLTTIFTDFFESERTAGLSLIFFTLVSLAITNASAGEAWTHFWHERVNLSFAAFQLDHSIEHWVNDGLMTVFFLLVGLEIERELYAGELASLKRAALPVFGALGGMLVPAGLYLLFNYGKPTRTGFGIPMATDIAFALGILSLAGKKIPASVKIFLTALAIIDDLGAIGVIALFYAKGFSLPYLMKALGLFGGLLVLNRFKVNNLFFYLIPGLLLWYFMERSGIHATISGVLLAFAVPFRGHGKANPSFRLQHSLHKPVAFLILPLFALANTGIHFNRGWTQSLFSDNSLGILIGLVAGKPAGILLFTGLAVRTGICRLPDDMKWPHLAGAGLLAGIGFTMSIFITNLAFPDPATGNESKIAILFASLLAGICGLVFLRRLTNKTNL